MSDIAKSSFVAWAKRRNFPTEGHEAGAWAWQAWQGAFEEQAAMHEALAAIRFAGNNTTAWAVWAQKMAAWGMEPNKWPKPDPVAPTEESTS